MSTGHISTAGKLKSKKRKSLLDTTEHYTLLDCVLHQNKKYMHISKLAQPGKQRKEHNDDLKQHFHPTSDVHWPLEQVVHSI